MPRLSQERLRTALDDQSGKQVSSEPHVEQAAPCTAASQLPRRQPSPALPEPATARLSAAAEGRTHRTQQSWPAMAASPAISTAHLKRPVLAAALPLPAAKRPNPSHGTSPPPPPRDEGPHDAQGQRLPHEKGQGEEHLSLTASAQFLAAG